MEEIEDFKANMIIYLFILYFWSIPNGAEDFFLTLRSGITPEGSWELIYDVLGEWTQVVHVCKVNALPVILSFQPHKHDV